MAGEADGADIAGEDVADGGAEGFGFVLEAGEFQGAVLEDDAIDGVDFFADVRACVLRQVCGAGSNRLGRLEDVGLAAAEALLDAAGLAGGGGKEVKVDHAAPGTIGDVEVAFVEWLERKGIIAIGAELELAITRGDFVLSSGVTFINQ